jgi:hypothetical protein
MQLALEAKLNAANSSEAAIRYFCPRCFSCPVKVSAQFCTINIMSHS